MRQLDLHEGGPRTEAAQLTVDEALVLNQSELAEVTRAPGSSTWSVAAGRKVGVIKIGSELQVCVRPKVPIARLLFMMSYARDPTYWREDLVELGRHLDLAAALAEAFRRFATRATERGLLQGYRTVEESLPVLRGRLRTNDQIRRRRGVRLPLEVTYDEFTVDIAENQLLLAATVRLLSLPGVPATARRTLHRMRAMLADVSHVNQAPRWFKTRLNAHYEPALRLAELILAGDSFEQLRGSRAVTVTGYALDLWKVYEDFVYTALAEQFDRLGGHAAPQYATFLDAARRVPIKPDLVWSNAAGPQVVVDAKYKAEKSRKFPNADLYQMLAYCTVLGRRHGHLVYAAGEGERRTYAVSGADVTLHCHTLDLTEAPEALLERVRRLAGRMLRPDSLSA